MGEIRIQSGDISSDEVEKLGTKVLEDLKDTEFQDNFVAIKNAMSKIHKSNENELQILLNLAEKEDLNGDQRKELLV